jgi:uncharacterized Zn finger protein
MNLQSAQATEWQLLAQRNVNRTCMHCTAQQGDAQTVLKAMTAANKSECLQCILVHDARLLHVY